MDRTRLQRIRGHPKDAIYLFNDPQMTENPAKSQQDQSGKLHGSGYASCQCGPSAHKERDNSAGLSGATHRPTGSGASLKNAAVMTNCIQSRATTSRPRKPGQGCLSRMALRPESLYEYYYYYYYYLSIAIINQPYNHQYNVHLPVFQQVLLIRSLIDATRLKASTSLVQRFTRRQR